MGGLGGLGLETFLTPDFPYHFPNFFRQELIELVVALTTMMKMKAKVQAMWLAVRLEKFEVKFVE